VYLPNPGNDDAPNATQDATWAALKVARAT